MKQSAVIHTDESLVDRLRSGEDAAFEALYDRYWSVLFAYVFNRLRDKELSKDIVQELFMDLWRRRETLETENLRAYLHSAVRFMTYRRLSRMPLTAPYFQDFEQTLVSSFFAEDNILERELRELLDTWILALPKKRRRIFLLHFTEDLSTEEIAQRLGITQKTVQNQLTTAYTEIRLKYAHFLSITALLILS